MPKRRAYPSRRSLLPGQAKEIKRLAVKYSYSYVRIAKLMGLSEGVVRSVIRGTAYADETGGEVVRINKESTRWKHGSKSYREVLCEQ